MTTIFKINDLALQAGFDEERGVDGTGPADLV